jgi:hypothetical protein
MPLVNRHVARSTAAHAADHATDPARIVLVDDERTAVTDRTSTTGGIAPPASGSQAGGSGAPSQPLMRPGTRPVDSQLPFTQNSASSGANLYTNYYPDYVYPQYPQFGYHPSGQNPAQYAGYGQLVRPHSAPPTTGFPSVPSSQLQPSGSQSSGSGLLPASDELNLFGNSQTAADIGSSMLGSGSVPPPPLQPPAPAAPDVPPPMVDLNDTHLDIVTENINQDNFSQQ